MRPITLSNALTLDEVLARLAGSEIVDGIALFGSQASDHKNLISDYDLLLVVRHPPVEIFQMLTHIDGRMADVVFIDTGVAERALQGGGPFSPASFEGMYLLKMQTAKILYDPSGILQHARQWLAQENKQEDWLQPARYPDLYSAWFWQNHSLIHLKRMVQSDDPVYLTAVDMMLLTGLGGVCRAYSTARRIPWQGEKAAVRYLQEHDPEFLALFRKCLDSTSRVGKVQLYEQLVEQALAPFGAIWTPGITAVYLRDPEQHETQVETALFFWESLLS